MMVMVMNMTKRDSPNCLRKEMQGRIEKEEKSFVDDLVDIILENEKYRQKLLLTNVKNAKNGQYMKSVVKDSRKTCRTWRSVSV